MTLNIDGSTAACVLAVNSSHEGVVSTAVDMGDGSYLLLYADGLLERTGTPVPPDPLSNELSAGGGPPRVGFANCSYGVGGWTAELPGVGVRTAPSFDSLCVPRAHSRMHMLLDSWFVFMRLQPPSVRARRIWQPVAGPDPLCEWMRLI